MTSLERPEFAETLEVSPEEARRSADAIVADNSSNPVTDPDNERFGFNLLSQVNGAFRASWIVEPSDGKLPYSEAGQGVSDEETWREKIGYDNPEERPT